MGFLIGKLVWLLIRFSTLVFLFNLAGVVLLWSGRARWGRRLVTAGLGLWLFVQAVPVDRWLLNPLESRFAQPQQAPGQVDGIIVLGGAVNTLLTEQYGIPSLNGEAERMTTFVMLARRYPQAKLAFTGGSGLLAPGSLSEADVARALFDQLDLHRPVTYEDRSRTTYENALFLREEVHPNPHELWMLVTSAVQMPRAVGVFRAAGWRVLPWPVSYKSGQSLAFQPDQGLVDRMQMIDLAMHEWAGLLAYWLLGRIDSPFPGPGP